MLYCSYVDITETTHMNTTAAKPTRHGVLIKMTESMVAGVKARQAFMTARQGGSPASFHAAACELIQESLDAAAAATAAAATITA